MGAVFQRIEHRTPVLIGQMQMPVSGNLHRSRLKRLPGETIEYSNPEGIPYFGLCGLRIQYTYRSNSRTKRNNVFQKCLS